MLQWFMRGCTMMIVKIDVTLIFRFIYYENPVFMRVSDVFHVKMLRM